MNSELKQKIIQMWGDSLNYPSTRSIARALNIPRTTLRRYLGRLVDSGLISEERYHDIDSEIIQLLKQQNSSLRRELTKEKAKTQMIIDACKASIAKMNIGPVPYPNYFKSSKNLEFHALRSDEHIGEEVDPAQVGGVSEYNTEVYKERLGTWVDKILLFLEQDRKSHSLNKLVIVRLGDTVTGTSAYRGQSFYVNLPAVDQLMIGVEEEIPVLQTLCSYFPEVESYCVVGNHGASGGKNHSHRRDNWDYLFYQFLKIAMKQQENYKMYISEGPALIAQHGNFNFFYHHGDTNRAYLGLPYYALDRQFNRLNTLYGVPIDYSVSAHFHTAGSIGGRLLLNGSFVGGTDLSINKLSLASMPTQKIFYFHHKYGVNRETDLYLDDKMVLEPDETGRIISSYS